MLDDQFTYPNGTLKNKEQITSKAELQEREYWLVNANAMEVLKHADRYPTNSIQDFQRLNRALFGQLYDWAGQIRHYDLSKSGHQFQPTNTMAMAQRWINHELSVINRQKDPSTVDYGNLLYDLNEFHPFREGNGRTTKVFLDLIAAHHRQFIVYERYQDELIRALNRGPEAVVAEMKIKKL